MYLSSPRFIGYFNNTFEFSQLFSKGFGVRVRDEKTVEILGKTVACPTPTAWRVAKDTQGRAPRLPRCVAYPVQRERVFDVKVRVLGRAKAVRLAIYLSIPILSRDRSPAEVTGNT
jgi:hypothetical protein